MELDRRRPKLGALGVSGVAAGLTADECVLKVLTEERQGFPKVKKCGIIGFSKGE